MNTFFLEKKLIDPKNLNESKVLCISFTKTLCVISFHSFELVSHLHYRLEPIFPPLYPRHELIILLISIECFVNLAFIYFRILKRNIKVFKKFKLPFLIFQNSIDPNILNEKKVLSISAAVKLCALSHQSFELGFTLTLKSQTHFPIISTPWTYYNTDKYWMLC